mgnify:CR=1 FL=1
MPTKFQDKVYNLLQKIPKGKVTTYKILAERIGIKAYRAVGLACAKNPYAPNIPCHRVVNSDGSLGGYSEGIERKITLLKQEGIKVKDDRIIDFYKVLFRFNGK